MAETVEKTQELLLQAKKETALAAKELDEVLARRKLVDDISLDAEVDFPKTESVLSEIEANVETSKKNIKDIDRLIGDAKTVRQACVRIDILGKRLEKILEQVFILDSQRRYDEALKWCDAIEEVASSENLGYELITQHNALEIAAWNRVCIYVHMAEDNIADGQAPMSDEELGQFEAKVQDLPTQIHPEEQKRRYLDRAVGYRLLNKARWALHEGNSYEVLVSCLDLAKDIRESDRSLSDLTRSRLAYLMGVCCDIFNYLSVDAFDARRNYPDAERLFLLRDNFELSSLVHADYRDATDVKDFHLRFLNAEAILMDDEAFAIAVYAYADSVRERDEFELEVLKSYLTLASLSPTKKDYLARALDRLSFELEIIALGETLPRGIDVEMQGKVLEGICGHKKRQLHLESCAKPLLNCGSLLDESLQKRFKILLADILRSPRARKVCVKSVNPDVHALFGENEETMRRPLGKAMDSDFIKAWGSGAKACYVLFALILTNALAVAGFAVIYWLCKDLSYVPYLLIAPYVVSLLILHLAICARFGRDERGSAVYRRVLAIDGLLHAAASLAYFAAPQALSALAPVGYTLIIVGAIEGLWAFFLYKDRNRLAAILTLVPLFLCEVVSLVLLILALMNGTLAG